MIERYVCQTDRVNGKKFGSIQDLRLKNVGTNQCGCIVARYWKGIEGSSSNCVLVKRRIDYEN